MIDGQLRPQGIFHDRLLDAIASVQRERYLPLKQQAIAYSDRNIPITAERCLLKVLTFARLMQEALLAVPDARNILIIGEPSLYGTAIARQLNLSVTLLDADIEHLKQQTHGDEHIHFHQGHLLSGCLPHAPYDIIVLAGFVEEGVSMRHLTQQLTSRGVLMVLVNDGISCSMMRHRARGGAVMVASNLDSPPLAMAHTSSSFAFVS